MPKCSSSRTATCSSSPHTWTPLKSSKPPRILDYSTTIVSTSPTVLLTRLSLTNKCDTDHLRWAAPTTTASKAVWSIQVVQWSHSDSSLCVTWWSQSWSTNWNKLVTASMTKLLHHELPALRHPQTMRRADLVISTHMHPSSWLLSVASHRSLRADGNARLRLNFANFGWMVSTVRTSSRSRAVGSPMVKTNFKRRRVSVSNTWHRYARTSWSTHPNALMDRDVFSSIPLMMFVSVKTTPPWSWTMLDIPLWGSSKRLRGPR